MWKHELLINNRSDGTTFIGYRQLHTPLFPVYPQSYIIYRHIHYFTQTAVDIYTIGHNIYIFNLLIYKYRKCLFCQEINLFLTVSYKKYPTLSHI